LDFDDIERILELMKQHELAEFELEREGLKLRVRKTGTGFSPMVSTGLTGPMMAPAAPAPTHAAVPPPAPNVSAGPGPSVAPGASRLSPADDAAEAEVELAVVKSPIVGTFYRAPEPGAPFFVDVGERVKKDQVLCIIEAMKLMNEITSEYEGEVASVYVENGKPVQYGERLFAIRTI
jgi:acetyl-CoA carboxylase biotin carboxyl carrier protein